MNQPPPPINEIMKTEHQHSIRATLPHPKLTLETKISQMRITLAPIYPLPAGPPHTDYPQTVLHYWLLTESQLDSLAAYYHQLSPTNPWHNQYPACMNWDPEFLAKPTDFISKPSKEELDALLSTDERVAIKRRMLGKFIGLRGCETPLREMQRKMKFLDDRMERSLKRERELMGQKWLFY